MRVVELTFQMELGDYQAFLRAVKGLPLRGLWPFALVVLMLEGLVSASNSELREHFASLGWGAFLPQLLIMLATLVFFVVVGLVTLHLHKMRVEKLPLFKEPVTLMTDEEGISGTTSRGRDTYFWAALHRIIETDTHFFVLSAPQFGVIIPKRVFDSPTQCAEFSAFLKQKWAQHHPDAAPIALPK